jgi:hypothetical protein
VNEGSEPNRPGAFVFVTGDTAVTPSASIPPVSLSDDFEPENGAEINGLEAYEFGFGTAFFDMDNDADEDLYWLGSIAARGEGPGGDFAPGVGRLLQNDGNGSFADITAEAHIVDALAVDYSTLDPDDGDFNSRRQRLGLEYHENGKGVAVGDLNGDGFVDVIGTNSNGETFDAQGERAVASGPLFVWMNSGGDNRWVSFRLTGRMGIEDGEASTGSNADAIGAKIFVTHTDANGNETTQLKEVLGSSSFLSMSSLDIHFGIGNASSVKARIEWPSGRTSNITDLELNKLHEIAEPAS